MSLSDFKKHNHKTKELITEFINKVRLANTTKCLASSRVDKIVSSLNAVAGEYGEQNMITGIEVVFAKDKKEGFTFKSSNPTGYISTVARNLHVKNQQQEIEKKAHKEKDKLRNAKGNAAYENIKSIME